MDDPTKTRGLLADLGHTDACVHPDQHAAVIREWEDAAAEVERLRKELAAEARRALLLEADVLPRCERRAERAEDERDALKAERDARRLECDEWRTRAKHADGERLALEAAAERAKDLTARMRSHPATRSWADGIDAALDHPTEETPDDR